MRPRARTAGSGGSPDFALLAQRMHAMRENEERTLALSWREGKASQEARLPAFRV